VKYTNEWFLGKTGSRYNPTEIYAPMLRSVATTAIVNVSENPASRETRHEIPNERRSRNLIDVQMNNVQISVNAESLD